MSTRSPSRSAASSEERTRMMESRYATNSRGGARPPTNASSSPTGVPSFLATTRRPASMATVMRVNATPRGWCHRRGCCSCCERRGERDSYSPSGATSRSSASSVRPPSPSSEIDNFNLAPLHQFFYFCLFLFLKNKNKIIK